MDNRNTEGKMIIAYRCPECGAGVLSIVDPISLGKRAQGTEMLRLKCSCGHSEMTLEQPGNGQIRVTVPCMMCAKPHVFTFRPEILSGQDCFTFDCPLSAVPVCYLGEMEHVKAQLAEDELKLLKILEENGVEDFKTLRSEEESGRYCDPEMLQSVMFVARDLAEEGKIVCLCEHPAPGAFVIEPVETGVRVACPRCGLEKNLPADFSPAAYAFLDTDRLLLTEDE